MYTVYDRMYDSSPAKNTGTYMRVWFWPTLCNICVYMYESKVKKMF